MRKTQPITKCMNLLLSIPHAASSRAANGHMVNKKDIQAYFMVVYKVTDKASRALIFNTNGVIEQIHLVLGGYVKF